MLYLCCLIQSLPCRCCLLRMISTVDLLQRQFLHVFRLSPGLSLNRIFSKISVKIYATFGFSVLTQLVSIRIFFSPSLIVQNYFQLLMNDFTCYAGCRDIDDALHCTLLSDGRYEVGVRILPFRSLIFKITG